MICTFLCAPFFIRAQEASKADSLFAVGEYLPARVAYERLLFNGHSASHLLILKKSYCLKAEGNYEDAYNTLQRADFFVGDDSLKFKLYYESILNAFLAGKHDLALNKIQELHYYLPGITQPALDLLEILTLNQLRKFEQAEEKYKSFVAVHNLRDDSNPYQKKNLKMKNPDRAESISHLLPGVGQMYAGYVGRGMTSLLIQSGLVAFGIYSFVNGYYFSGAFTGVGLFYIFNNGGARHAYYLAEKRNKALITRIDTEVKGVLLKEIKK